MFGLVHKLQRILNDLKGFDAGYTTDKITSLFIAVKNKYDIENTAPTLFKIEFEELGIESKFDVVGLIRSEEKIHNDQTFNLVFTLAHQLEEYKSFSTACTMNAQETLYITYEGTLFKGKVTCLGKEKLRDQFTYLKI